MELYFTPKSQHTTVKHSRQLLEHTYTSDPHGLGTLTPIEFFQQDLLWQSSNTRSHLEVIKLPNTRRDNPSSGYRSTCTPQRHLGVYIINPPFTSPDDRMSSPSTVSLRITSNLYSFSDHIVFSPALDSLLIAILLWKRLFHCYRFVFIVALTREYNNDAPFNCCVTGESWYVTICAFISSLILLSFSHEIATMFQYILDQRDAIGGPGSTSGPRHPVTTPAKLFVNSLQVSVSSFIFFTPKDLKRWLFRLLLYIYSYVSHVLLTLKPYSKVHYFPGQNCENQTGEE
jgi:hypothetical protein